MWIVAEKRDSVNTVWCLVEEEKQEITQNQHRLCLFAHSFLRENDISVSAVNKAPVEKRG